MGTILDYACGCKTDPNITLECAKNSNCVFTAYKSASETDEMCLPLCVNSDTVNVVANCACKDPKSNSIKHARVGSLCKDDGIVMYSCPTDVLEACLCAKNTCQRGQKCVSGVCQDASPNCTDFNKYPTPGITCKCGTHNCITGANTSCLKVSSNELYCLEKCTAVSISVECACGDNSQTTDLILSPPYVLCIHATRQLIVECAN